MAGRPKKPKSVAVRMSLSPKLYGYLSYLARHTVLGGDENDVAKYVLTKGIESMIAKRYHETELPPEDEQDG